MKSIINTVYNPMVCFIRLLHLLTLCFAFFSPFALANVWEDFKNAKQNNQVLPIPDFSYAGYKHAEQSIPKPNWRVFNVVDYGAQANDNGDDLAAVKRAISDAQKANGGIVFFPKGQFLLSEQVNVSSSLIEIEGGNIILRGSGSGVGGTELFFRQHLRSTTPDKKWTTPKMISANGSSSSYKGHYVTRVSSNAKLGGFSFNVNDASTLSAGDFIVINLNDKAAANDAWVSPYRVENNWSKFKTGEIAREYHQIAKVEGSRVTLKEPLHIDINANHNWEVRSIELAQNFGIEDLAFRGNWQEVFSHHQDVIHDSGWSALNINKYAHSWLNRVRFIDWNATVNIGSSVAISLINIEEAGNRGHSGIHIQNSYGVLVTHSHDKGDRGQFHSFGVSNYAAGTVFHRSSWPKDTSFDAHASFPRATLYDRVDGGFSGASGGAGGSDAVQPNHMRNLIFWNFKDLGQGSRVAKDWWRTDSKYGRFLLPKLIGWHGAEPIFTPSQLGLNESFGRKVEPESLYEAQLALRLGSVPSWLKELNGGGEEPGIQQPYRGHSIPGKIQAEDYDQGGEGLAYHDVNSGNSGSAYRQDSVDIQATTDAGGGFNVGWVANSEWLEYSVANVQAGTYTVNIRIAASGSTPSSTSGKAVNLALGGKSLGSINVGGTGGWQDWQTLSLKNVNIATSGAQLLKLSFVTGSFNINWVEFVKNTTPTVDQCNTTAECKRIFGSGATDCADSRSDKSICMCGNSRCD